MLMTYLTVVSTNSFLHPVYRTFIKVLSFEWNSYNRDICVPCMYICKSSNKCVTHGKIHKTQENPKIEF